MTDIWADMVQELGNLHKHSEDYRDPNAWKNAKVGDRVRVKDGWYHISRKDEKRGVAGVLKVTSLSSDPIGIRLRLHAPKQGSWWADNEAIMEIVK